MYNEEIGIGFSFFKGRKIKKITDFRIFYDLFIFVSNLEVRYLLEKRMFSPFTKRFYPMQKISFCFFFLIICHPVLSAPDIHLTRKDNLFIRVDVPEKGIVCANQKRAERISKSLKNVKAYETAWGPKVYIGNYKNQKIFVASTPVGSGSGLVFTELYAAGAKYIIRYGSDDVKNPLPHEKDSIKIIDETDNLYGFDLASGLDPTEFGKSVFASPKIIEALKEEAKDRNLSTEIRVCHHLENYHALRTPGKFSPERKKRLEEQLVALKREDKKESFDMESAVLFRVAKDFDQHAAAVLQTVDKENKSLGPYEGTNKEQALHMEKVFTEYTLSALARIK